MMTRSQLHALNRPIIEAEVDLVADFLLRNPCVPYGMPIRRIIRRANLQSSALQLVRVMSRRPEFVHVKDGKVVRWGHVAHHRPAPPY